MIWIWIWPGDFASLFLFDTPWQIILEHGAGVRGKSWRTSVLHLYNANSMLDHLLDWFRDAQYAARID